MGCKLINISILIIIVLFLRVSGASNVDAFHVCMQYDTLATIGRAMGLNPQRFSFAYIRSFADEVRVHSYSCHVPQPPQDQYRAVFPIYHVQHLSVA